MNDNPIPIRYKIVIEKYALPHNPGPANSEQRVEVLLKPGMSEETANQKLKLMAVVLDCPIASLTDEPPILYVSQDGLYGVYLTQEVQF